ncbi:hypothetical protein [Streptomyces sp. enrichment culture]|uniref:hypothetical protein n=1 Tax=Streptomyces sp. enrichment culture TaxID=1795815 RepID=UPI003F542AAB
MTDWREAWPAGTAEDLVEDARSLGIRASPRMVTDYVEVGLLAPPLFRKTTQRGSDRRVFPSEQRRLFYELNCAKLRSPLARVPHRTMVPVVLYLWCLDDTVVTDTQARRALRTYAQNVGISSDPRRRTTARKVVEQFAHPLATVNQRRAAQQWIREGELTRRPNWNAVADALSTIASPWRSHGLPEIVRGIGPPNAPVTTDHVVAMWELNWQINQQLAEESVNEQVLKRAREEHRSNWREYQSVRTDWESRAGTMRHLFELPDNQEQAARQHVKGFVTVLGNTLGLAKPTFARAQARAKARLR